MGFLFVLSFLVFYLVAFSDGEEGKTKVGHETPREIFRNRVVNEYTNMYRKSCKLSILLQFASRH